jgi:chaperonin GroES
MSIQPLFDRVLVRRKEAPKTTASGLILPDSAMEKLNQGTIVAVGTGYVNENGTTSQLQVKVGDVVAFGKFSGNTINVDGEELLIFNEKEILGIITE